MSQIFDRLDLARINFVFGKELLVVRTERADDFRKIVVQFFVLDTTLLVWCLAIPLHERTSAFSSGNAACAASSPQRI